MTPVMPRITHTVLAACCGEHVGVDVFGLRWEMEPGGLLIPTGRPHRCSACWRGAA